MKWTKRTLGTIYDLEKGSVQTGPFGSQLHESDYKEFGIPVIMPKDIVNDRLDTSSIAHISEEDAKRLKKHLVILNDIVYPRRGDIGKRIIVDGKSIGAFCGTGCIRLRGSGEILDPKFLFFYLKQKAIIKWIENQAIGATMMNLNTSILRSVPVYYPELETQKKIANILSAYDDLIENNHQRIQLLEEMAAEIYKEWFVRFRFPGYESATFVDKEGKEVPQGTNGALPLGWERGAITDLVEVSDGTHDSPKRTTKGHYLITGKNIKNGFIDINGAYFISSEDHIKIQKRSFFNIGDIIFSNIGTIGASALIFEKPNYSLKNVIILRPVSRSNSCYIHSLIKSKYTQAVFQNEMTGASQQFLSLSYMRNFKIIKPKNRLLKEFESIVSKMNNLSYKLYQKNQTLQQTRDLLLPRLISGKLSVENLALSTIEAASTV